MTYYLKIMILFPHARVIWDVFFALEMGWNESQLPQSFLWESLAFYEGEGQTKLSGCDYPKAPGQGFWIITELLQLLFFL